MNAWTTIKEHFTNGSTPGSYGYLMEVQKAAFLYSKINWQLKAMHQTTADEMFNADEEVRKALLTPTLDV